MMRNESSSERGEAMQTCRKVKRVTNEGEMALNVWERGKKRWMGGQRAC